MKISIIIPMYNCELTLSRCLNSILSQTYKEFEVILIDDGSEDETANLCYEYTKKYKNFLYFYQKNSGPSCARRNGIHKAKNEFIMFIDSDDYLDSNYLEKIVNGFKENYINGANFCMINKEKKYFSKRKSEDIPKALSDIFNKKIGGYSCGYLLEKSKIKDEYFDLNTKFMEDTLFLLNYSINFKGFNFIEGTFYNYVYNENSLSKNPNRIIENILSANYVVNVSVKKMQSQKVDIDLSDNLFNLINSQLFEIKKISDLKSIIFNDKVKDILNNIKSSSLVLKIYKLCYKINNYLPLYFYIKSRNMIKIVYLKIRGR